MPEMTARTRSVILAICCSSLFVVSLDNTIVSAFVQVSGTTPWPVYVLSSLRSGLRPEIAAVSTVMLVLTLLALALVALVLKRAGDSATEIARTMAGG